MGGENGSDRDGEAERGGGRGMGGVGQRETGDRRQETEMRDER